MNNLYNSAITITVQFERGISFTVDKNLHENQRLYHIQSINAFKSSRFQVIETLTLLKVNALTCFNS
jgi:hypothetical protein